MFRALFSTIIISIICLINHSFVNAQQKNQPLLSGYGISYSYNLYAYNVLPGIRDSVKISTGQVLNILPGIHFNFWFGNIDKWLLSLDAGITFLPFALDLNKVDGLGSLKIPIQSKIYFPLKKNNSLWLQMHVGLGCMFQKNNLYLSKSKNPIYAASMLELGIHISAVGYKKEKIKSMEFFINGGIGFKRSFHLQFGIRLNFKRKFRSYINKKVLN